LADTAWTRACLALRLMSLDPGLGGICIRARSGPVRDRLAAQITGDPARLHPAITDEALFGGLDLSATLAAGHVVEGQGIIARHQTLILTMAERATPRLAAQLATVLDGSSGHRLIALDEGAEPDEALNAKLAERLAFHVDLADCSLGEAVQVSLPTTTCDPHRVHVPAETIDQITRVAATLGVRSLRAPSFALRAARAHAALHGRMAVTEDDVAVACALTLAHRATQVPETQPETEEPSPPPQQEPTDSKGEGLDLPDEMLLEAVRALLPDNLLDQLRARQARAGRGSGTGAARKGNRRGRPLPSRAGRIQDGARIDLMATLRAAAPWQTIRRRASGRGGLHIRADDIRLRRFEEKSDRLLIFTVDASGSAALARLAEAKGAVELLLAQAYARRDHVALVAFRGTGADLLLPPTRSLVQTKRRLAALPGGGGTPLAAGIETGLQIARQGQAHGMTPTLVLLTDGRANIALDGSANRQMAGDDAQRLARICAGEGFPGLVIDTSVRPQPALATLAQTMNAPYLAMPRADAHRMSAAVSETLDA